MIIKKVLITAIIAGTVMGLGLFITGAIASFLIYGPQFAPQDKFEPEQLNAWYFFWTKIVIGWVFGVIFSMIYREIYSSLPGKGTSKGFLYSFFLWLIISLWNMSHPLVYESINFQDQLFWHIYTLGGFLAYGATLGYVFKKIFIIN